MRFLTPFIVSLSLVAPVATATSAPASDHHRSAGAAPAAVAIDGYSSEGVRIPTRDGDQLVGELSFPTDHGTRVPGPLPVVLLYTPYCKEFPPSAPPRATFTSHGYVLADVAPPGACGSTGRFTAWAPAYGRAGYDAVEWLARQQWSSGKVGMFGQSADGISQLHTARTHPPHLVTIAPTIASADFYRDVVYPGGIFNFADVTPLMSVIYGEMYGPGVALRDHNPASSEQAVEGGELTPDDLAAQIVAHPLFDDFWRSRSVNPRSIRIPILSLGNFDDFFPRSTINLFLHSATKYRRLVIGGLGHEAPGPNLKSAETLDWMDYWLKGVHNDVPETLAEAPVEYYVMGAGRWESASRWPPTSRRLTLRVAAGSGPPLTDGVLTPGPADGGTSVYAYAPEAGLSPSHDGFNPVQGDQHGAGTALTFAGSPLTADTEVTGEPKVTLKAATTAPDTDWIVRLIDIPPGNELAQTDNRYSNWTFVTNGQLRASHRAGDDHLETVPAGEPVTYTIQVRPMSYEFAKGHRIGLQITSADPTRSIDAPFPALNTVFHGTSLTLPLGPAAALPAR